MNESVPKIRLRYPLHAVLLVGLSWGFYAVVLVICALFMLPCVPLAPLFVMMMLGLGGLLGSVHEYARAVATPMNTTTLRSRKHGQVPQASHGSTQAS